MRTTNPKNVAGVYCILNRVNGKRYIGSSIYVFSRIDTHKRKLKKRYHPNPILQNAWNKHGESNFEFTVLETMAYKNVDDVTKLEQKYIDTLKPEYNILPFARTGHGRKHTEESKKKMREHHANVKGKNNPMFGRGLYGKDNGMFGRKHSDESKRLIGLKSIERRSKPIRVSDSSGFLFDAKNMNEVIGRLRPIDAHKIRQVVRGELPSYKGYVFKLL